jgi:hypothetical protein
MASFPVHDDPNFMTHACITHHALLGARVLPVHVQLQPREAASSARAAMVTSTGHSTGWIAESLHAGGEVHSREGVAHGDRGSGGALEAVRRIAAVGTAYNAVQCLT